MSATYHDGLEVTALALILQTNDFAKVDGIVDPNFFSLPSNGFIWSAIEGVNAQGLVVSAKTIEVELDSRGLLSALIIPSKDAENKPLRGVDVLNYLKKKDVAEYDLESVVFQLRDAQAARMTVTAVDAVKRAVLDGTPIAEVLADVDMRMGKISMLAGTKSSNIKDSKAVAHGIWNIFEKGVRGEHEYLETGLKAWDNYTEGLYPGRVYIIAGTSGSGKSTLGQNIAYWLSINRDIVESTGRHLNENIKGAIISLEMDESEVGGRLLRMVGGVKFSDIEKGRVKDTALFSSSLETLRDADLLYDNSTELTLPMLRAKMRKMAVAGAKYIIIDQLGQLSTGLSESMGYNDKDFITYRIKAFAREFNLAVVIMHQMNKSSDAVSRKDIFNISLADLQESGQNAVDGICFVRRDSQKCALVWVKLRQGHDMQTDIAYLDFDIMRTLFKDGEEWIPDELKDNEDD